jgi:large subunit ribosomal protein L18
MVVRKTNRHVICQLVRAEMIGDKTFASAHSKELLNYGYTGSLSSTPAAYLTGMLFAVRCLKMDEPEAILDIGLHRACQGARVFAALKGAVEIGMEIPHGEEILPSHERCMGQHIVDYDDKKSDLPENVKIVIDAIRKELN